MEKDPKDPSLDVDNLRDNASINSYADRRDRDFDDDEKKDEIFTEVEPHGDEPSALEDGDANGAPLSKKSNRVSVANSIPPNGGLRAWSQVLGAFFIFFNSWGIINTYGVYQTYYQTTLLPTSTSSSIAWVGSVQQALLMLVGAATGPLYDAGYFRQIISVGSFLIVFGHMMLSLCKEYWQVLLAQGFVIGAGTGCLFVPGVAILSTYFSTKVATSVGIAATGSSLGGVLYPIIARQLIPRLGFPWAVRICGFVALATLLVPNALMRVRVLPAQRRKIFDWSAWREPPYVLFVLGQVLGMMGLYTPFFYIQVYCIQNKIMSEDLAFYQLSILNAASTFGRVLPNVLADRIGPFNVILPCALMAGVLTLCLIAAKSSAAVIVIVAFFGFFSGTYVSAPPTILFQLSPNRGVLGTRMGMSFVCVGCGMLIGPPISGAILSASGYTSIWVYGGVIQVLGALVIAGGRVSKYGWSLKAKG